MLRPERMSKVSVTGSKAVMDAVIEAIHDLNLVHLSDYDGSWEGFENGDPVEGAEAASEKLVTVRSLESLLDVDESDAGPRRIVTDEALETELERIREEANELDDRRNDLQRDLREIDERIGTMEPFVDLGIDLDLLRGYDSLDVAVGEGQRDAVEAALADADGIEAFETFGSNGVVAAFVYPTDDAPEDVLDEALVATEFTRLERPDAEGDPEEHVAELEHRKQKLRSRKNTVEEELHELKLDAAGFLLAAEEKLSIQVQKTEAPLRFATTENAFVAEGWIPSDRVADLESGLRNAVGDRVDVEELERAEYDDDGLVEGHEAVEEEDGGDEDEGEETMADRSEPPKARADGGVVSMGDDNPPIIQKNPDVAEPFEAFVRAVGLPNYSELDPTVILLLIFPAFFGFMIGDLGYGLVYLGLGAYIYTRFESGGIKSMGGIAIWAGAFTMLFGILYGEVFGTHQVSSVFWEGIVGLESAPIKKGLMPVNSDYALLWLVVSLLAGLVHLTVGYAFGFVDDLVHGTRDALFENGSWLLMMVGLWTWIFSFHAQQSKPGFIVGEGAALNGNPIPLGFGGFPEIVGMGGLAVFGVGLVMLAIADLVEVVEFLQVIVNVLSYARLAAVLLAKAGMAFVVNLLFFGVYVTGEGEHEAWHFGIGHMPHVGEMAHGHEVTSIMFPGLAHSGVAGLVGGLAILVVGHLLVLALGVTSAGLQGVRLEYVEFFGKFYQGNGKPYNPFGHDPEFTSGD